MHTEIHHDSGPARLACWTTDHDLPFEPAFISLLITQFLGAANDNILKQVLTFMVATGGLWGHPFGRHGLGEVANRLLASA